MRDYFTAELFRIRRKNTLILWMVPLILLMFLFLLIQSANHPNPITTKIAYLEDIRFHSLDIVEAMPFYSFPILFYAVYMEDHILGTQERNLAQNLQAWQFILAKAALSIFLQVLTCVVLLIASWISYGIITETYRASILDFLTLMPNILQSILVMITGVFAVTMIAAAALYAFNSALSGLVSGMLLIVHVPALFIHYLGNEIPALRALTSLSWDIRYLNQLARLFRLEAGLDLSYFVMAVAYAALAILWQLLFIRKERH